MNRIFKTLLPFLLIGAVVLFTYLGINAINEQKTYTPTTATITDITVDTDGDEIDHHVLVQYTVNGKEYRSELGSYSSSMCEGDEISVRYNPENPNQVVQSGYTGIILFFAFAVLSLISSVVVIIKKLGGRF